MDIYLDRLMKPWIIALLSILSSLIVYFFLAIFIDFPDFILGVYVAIGISFVISYPISFVFIQFHEKIKKQNEELVRLDFTTKKLFSVIAHDIRSPLASLKSLMNAVESNSISVEEGAKYIELLSSKTDDILLFLDGLLFWSHEQIANKQIEKRLFSTKKVLTENLSFLSDSSRQKNIQIIVQNKNFDIWNDEASYSFILRNVIQNAIKFTPNNGEITIQFEEDKKCFTTIVKDNGVGISPHNLKKIMDGDNWVSTTGTNGETGTGFALKTCIYYANQNQGSFQIESKENEGTTISFRTRKNNKEK